MVISLIMGSCYAASNLNIKKCTLHIFIMSICKIIKFVQSDSVHTPSQSSDSRDSFSSQSIFIKLGIHDSKDYYYSFLCCSPH